MTNKNSTITNEDIIKEFISSKDMQEYLLRQKISPYIIFQIIKCAPAPLNKKYEFVKALSSNLWEHFYKDALDGLNSKENELFYVHENWYDYDFYERNQSPTGAFNSFEEVVEYINNDIEENELDEDSLCWYTVEKWAKIDGEYQKLYDYILIKDEPVFAKPCLKKTQEALLAEPDINLQVPFKAGDIVEIDCTPFYPKFRACVLHVGDNRDCCGLQVLYKLQGNNIFQFGALKHLGLFLNMKYSPLYKLKKCNSSHLSKNEMVLLDVSKAIDSEETGNKLCDLLCKSGIRKFTTANIENIIDELKGE